MNDGKIKSIPIYERLGSFRPKVNATAVVSRLLSTVPPDYLAGLGSIVLSAQSELAREERRKSYRSRKRKVPASHVLGFYQAAWRGQPAWIETYVDRVYAKLPAWAARIPVIGFMYMGDVLFHEIGHHIHATQRPEYIEKEDVAEKWKRELLRSAMRKRYGYLRPLRPLFAGMGRLARFIVSRYYRRADRE